jgi:uncharacterized phiE125 gp8 family phage protein
MDDTSEDTLISALIKVARRQVELRIGRKLINQTVTLICDDFPAGDWELPFPPISAVSIAYRDVNGVSQSVTTHTLRNGSQVNLPAILQEPAAGWPAVDDYPSAVTLTLTCGYGAAATNLPEGLIHAVKMLAGHYYENRGVVTVENLKTIPMHIDAMLDEHRWRFQS